MFIEIISCPNNFQLDDQAEGHIKDPMIDSQPRTGSHELNKQGHWIIFVNV